MFFFSFSVTRHDPIGSFRTGQVLGAIEFLDCDLFSEGLYLGWLAVLPSGNLT